MDRKYMHLKHGHICGSYLHLCLASAHALLFTAVKHWTCVFLYLQAFEKSAFYPVIGYSNVRVTQL